MDDETETFTDDDVIRAIEQWLKYGEDSYIPCGERLPSGMTRGHHGNYAGCGWASRCLRWHLWQFQQQRAAR